MKERLNLGHVDRTAHTITIGDVTGDVLFGEDGVVFLQLDGTDVATIKRDSNDVWRGVGIAHRDPYLVLAVAMAVTLGDLP